MHRVVLNPPEAHSEINGEIKKIQISTSTKSKVWFKLDLQTGHLISFRFIVPLNSMPVFVGLWSEQKMCEHDVTKADTVNSLRHLR